MHCFLVSDNDTSTPLFNNLLANSIPSSCKQSNSATSIYVGGISLKPCLSLGEIYSLLPK